MGLSTAFRLRMERRRWQLRAIRRRRDLAPVSDRTDLIGKGNILAFLSVRNEKPRLPYFLDYYRRLGVDHFLFVDNGSDDGGCEYLAAQPDVSVWRTNASYRRSRYGTDWMNWLKFRYGHGHWTLTLDPDEFLVYPFCDTRPLSALCDWLDQSGIRSFGTLMVDMYPKGPLSGLSYREGQDPFSLADWFDPGNYSISKNPKYGNLWIQGGPRARVYFPDAPEEAPSLNKIPLVRWDRKYAFVSSTHMLLPRGLNQVYDRKGGEKTSGCLLHAKFLDSLIEKAAEEVVRREHFARGREYAAYHLTEHGRHGLWCKWSERLTGWRQLETLGLMSKGNWA
ncbi:glycosyltransferase family 2 protein [Alphaproteobacteria bacterium GH1-50]|uniref:Glycosyltransferase family 2 protein n=1 Tax=Kangsaoukella pontilimi TaxID=2691042 RepID=A0A7C9IGG5_9RHOB|nr:glycosyltransferase family 2 protein [Kangsaoukella pontilimi]MXQ08308.1 glycosyltransferase family 2 protein [Kangsaoukella pontilimi]